MDQTGKLQRAAANTNGRSRPANSLELELDEVTPRRLLWRSRTVVLVLRARAGEWFVASWFEGSTALAAWWRIVDPSGLERVSLGERTRVSGRRAPAWVARAFDGVRVVGERDGAPALELEAIARCA